MSPQELNLVPSAVLLENLLRAHIVVVRSLPAALHLFQQFLAVAPVPPVSVYLLQTLCMAQGDTATRDQLQESLNRSTESLAAHPVLTLTSRQVLQVADAAAMLGEPRVIEGIYASLMELRPPPTPTTPATASVPTSSSDTPSSDIDTFFSRPRDVAFLYDRLTQAHVRHGQVDQALTWLNAMSSSKLPPSLATLAALTTSLLQAIATAQATASTLPSAASVAEQYLTVVHQTSDRLLTTLAQADEAQRPTMWRREWSDALVGGWIQIRQPRQGLAVLDRLLDLLPPAASRPLETSAPQVRPALPTESVQTSASASAPVPVPSLADVASRILEANPLLQIPTDAALLAEQAELEAEREAERVAATKPVAKAATVGFAMDLVDGLKKSSTHRMSPPSPSTAVSSVARARATTALQTASTTPDKHTFPEPPQASAVSLPLPATLAALVAHAATAGAAHSTLLLHALFLQAHALAPHTLPRAKVTATTEHAIECLLAHSAPLAASRRLIATLPTGHDTGRLQLLALSAHRRDQARYGPEAVSPQRLVTVEGARGGGAVATAQRLALSRASGQL
jgi:hypothetical protein